MIRFLTKLLILTGLVFCLAGCAAAVAQGLPVPVSAEPPPIVVAPKPKPPESNIPIPSLIDPIKAPKLSVPPISDALGTLVDIQGAVAIHHASDSKPVAATVDMPVRLHDLIATGLGARAVLLLIDGTQLALGENAQFTVDDYIFNPDRPAADKARYSIAAGAFIYIGGQIAKTGSSDTQIRTPNGTIGVRDTVLWAGQIEDEYGVLAQQGRVAVTTMRGRIVLDNGANGAMRDARTAPKQTAPWTPGRLILAYSKTALKDPFATEARIAKLRMQQADRIAAYARMTQSMAPPPADKRRIEHVVDRPKAPTVTGPGDAPTFERQERQDYEHKQEVYIPRDGGL